MKTSKLFGLALLAISLCFTACDEIRTPAGINADLDGDGIIDGTHPSHPSTPSIRPYKIDMAGVQGFAIVENTSKSPRTKADINGDGVDDDMPNGNESEAVNTSPYALYTIDENGELHVSIFYFEVVQSENGETDASYTEVMKEVSNALQIVPSLVTDLGKYILFSGCQYQILDSDISDEARAICESFVQSKGWVYQDVTYMIRKSDGALFDLSGQSIFCYTAHDELDAGSYYPKYEGPESYIPQATYLTSQQNNLFVLGGNPHAVYRVEDNGDAVDFRQMTQHIDNRCLFSIDATENIYIAELHSQIRELDIYGANGGFNLHQFNSYTWIFDRIIDESGTPFIFIASDYSEFLSARLINCSVEFISKQEFNGQEFRYKESIYVGCNDNFYNWCDYCSILSYNKNTHQWSLRNISNDIQQILEADYDTIVYGSKTYCATVKGSSIEVIKIDFSSETYRTYSLDIDMSSIIPTSYGGHMRQDVPYMTIKGRSPINGAEVLFTIDLISGVNNSTFAQDGRNVVSFFRIN